MRAHEAITTNHRAPHILVAVPAAASAEGRQLGERARLVLVGEPFWHEPPPEEAFVALECRPEDFTSLCGTLDRFDAAGLELIEMVLADGDDWDRYAAAQWWTIDQWIRAHRVDARAPEMHELLVKWRRAHLEYGRRYLGWGVFVLR